MHPVANEVEIPLEPFIRLMLKAAVPGFTGSRTVYLRVKPEAAKGIEWMAESLESQRVDQQMRSPSWREMEQSKPVPPAIARTREQTVTDKLQENASRFRLGTEVTKVTGHFLDGYLQKLDLGTVE